MEKNQLVDELIDLIDLFDAQMTERQIDLYISALSDIDPRDLHVGIVELVKTSKWMPKVAEIRQAADLAREKREDNEVIAWSQRYRAMKESPWKKVEPWDWRGGQEKPNVINWKTCDRCNQAFANWKECPRCSWNGIGANPAIL